MIIWIGFSALNIAVDVYRCITGSELRNEITLGQGYGYNSLKRGFEMLFHHIKKIEMLIISFLTAPWCVLTRFSPVSCFADLQEQNVFKIDFEHKFEKFRTLAFHWYQFYQDLNNFY